MLMNFILFMNIFRYYKKTRKVKSHLLLSLAFSVITTFSFGQTEVCNNGIDDDFDGFIDCYDGSCSNDPACDGIFLGNDAKCSVPPPQFPQFTMTLDFASPNETTNHLSRMAIGDLDRDGIPELISMNRYTKKIFILNGNDGSIKREATVTWEPQWEVAIANLDNDNCGEIFFIGYQNPPGPSNDGIYLFAYDCNLNFLWQTAERLRGDPINYGLADFDGDGLVELYAKDEIYDAKTGVRIIKSTAATYNRINGGPVAVDISGDSKLELINGLSIYQVNLGTRTLDAGSLTLLSSRPEYFIRNEYNATSVADFNLDGFLDIIASGSETSNNNTTTIFYWDVQNNVVKTYRDLASDYGPNGWSNGTGRVNIADLDGDGNLNASYVSGKYLYALKGDLTLLWRIVINEETSGYTGCTLFDFNGDGKSEIVYRDEQFLYIIDGTDGSVYNQKTCISRTNREYPIVADVDADGSTELCVTCGFDDVLAKTNFSNLNFSRFSHIRVFKSAAEPWVPARRVWNQHGYFVVNINDDLTVPKVLQKHQLVFSTGSCTQGPNRPLNKFLNQSPFLNSEGCPTYASPDLAFSIAPSVIPPTCPDLNFTVSFQIINLGDVGLSGNIPITFYTKNPTLAGSTKLNTITIALSDFKPNDLFDVVNATVNGVGSDSLYVVLNDGGTTVPTPISLPNTTFFECDYDNILGVKVIPKPVTITALAVSPNEKCSPPDNGSARAFIPISGGGENTADYNFYWSDGVVAKPIISADFIGPIYSGIAEGTYTVYAIHKTANCSSDTVQVVITSVQSIVPPITITVVSHQTQCNPPNGKLEAMVQGGNSGYSFEWFDNASSLGVTTSVASGLIGGNYTVRVSRNGCTETETALVNDDAPDPDVTPTSTPVVNCQNPNSGTVSATVSIGGVPQPSVDYNFIWYFYDNATSTRGSQLPAANGIGPTRAGLVAGFYQVFATNTSSQCPSLPRVIEVQSQTVIPVVTITQLAPQTSCDPANPNGKLQATVTIGGVPQNPADFTFEWFLGQNTSVSHPDVSGTNGSIAEKIKGGGQAYTVKATSASQCFSTDDGVVTETLNVPIVSLTASPNSICDPSLVSGAATFQGSVTANVIFAGNPVIDFTNYQFEWYNGTQAIGAKRPETSSPLLSLDNGFYTLVVTRSDILCPSTPKTAEVANTTTLPAITANGVGSTNCVPALANGQAIVTSVDGAGTASPYLFKWHTGSTTATPIAGATAAILTNLQGATGAFFTVLVTNQSNGCQNTATVEVPDSKVVPSVTLAATPNSICDQSLTNPNVPFNGSVTATVTNQIGAITNYSFAWKDLETNTALGAFTGPVLSNRDSSRYSVVTTHVLTGCVSTPVNVQILNITTLPALVMNAIGSTNCTTSANGKALVATINTNPVPNTGILAPFAFEWFTGSTTTSLIAGASDGILEGRQGAAGAFFTARVTDLTNGCRNTGTVEVPDNKILPLVTLAAAPNSICDQSLTNPVAAFNGSVTATVTNQVGAIGDYTFAWRDNETNTAIGAFTGPVLSNRDSSRYTVVATHVVTGCVSSPVNAQVLNITTLPVLLMDEVGSTNCNLLLSNGKAIVSSINTTPVPPTGLLSPYAFEWFSGNSPTTVIAGANDGILEGRQGGIGSFFTVRVTDQSNGCRNTAVVEVPDEQSLPVVTLSSTDNKNCSAPFNGTASVNTITYKGAGEPLAGYSFAWTHGPTTATTVALNAGTYTLRVTRVDVGCTSNPVQVDVDNNLYIPVINVAITNQTSCDVLNPNGILSASMDETSIGGGPSMTGGYIYNWTNDGNPLTPGGPSVGVASVINSLSGNLFYTLTVERSATRCSNTQTVFLPERINLPRLELVATDIIDCNTQGFVTAKIFIDKNNDGDSNDAGDELTPAEYADYSIAWFRGSNTSGTPLSETDRVLNELSIGVPLPAGNYTAIATNSVTSCKTTDISDVINGPGPLFNLDFEINNRPASCADSDGVITAFVDSGGGVPAPFGNFTFQWFKGNPTNGLDIPTPSFYTTPVIQFVLPALDVDPASDFGSPYPGSPAPQAPTSINTGPTLFGRESGTYSVVVTNNTSGCKEFKTFFLPFLQEPVIILARIKPDECAVDVGEIEVELSAPFPANQYILQIYSSANPTLGGARAKPDINPAAALSNTFTGLASGIYTIVARENPAIIPTACYSSPVLVQLIEALPPKVDITGSGVNTTCVASPLAGDGSLQIKISTDTNDPFSAFYPLPPPPTILQQGAAPFVTYSLAVKDAGNVAISGYNPNPTAFEDGDTELINGLRGETYTITVTSSKGCVTTKTFGIPNSPRVADLSGDVMVLPSLACDPALETNASIEVKNLSIAGVIANDNLSDYHFDWFTNVTLTTNILSADGDNNILVKGGEVLSNVGPPLPSTPVTAGPYWVRATKVNAGTVGGLGCLSAPLKVDIENQSVKPTGTLTSLANTACDTNFEGSVVARITNAGSMPATLNYNYTWTSPATSLITNAISNGDGLGADDIFPGLSDGTYALSFKNNSSGCIGVIQTTIDKSATPIVVINATPVDQLICNPDGSIAVGTNDILVGGAVDNDHTRFDFTWARRDVATTVAGPTQSNDVLNIIDLPAIGADTYFVKVKKRAGLNPGSGCESAPFRVDILDKSVDPTVTLASLPNTSCDTNFEGSLKVTVTSPGSAATPNYNYVWTTPVASPIANATSNGDGLGLDDNFANLSDGTYTISIKNNTSGCFGSAQTIITRRSTPIIITNATPINQFICNPDGSITVGANDILVGGAVDNDHTRFDFTWARGDFATTVAGPTQSNDVLNILDLPTIGADTYFVKVKKRAGLNPGSGCESAPFRVDILDKSVDPTVTIASSANTSCDTNFEGSLIVTVTNPGSAATPGYDYTWISPAASPIANATSNGDGLGPDDNFANLSDGTYNISIKNNTSGCFGSAQTIINKLATSIIITNATPIDQLICNPDGSITVGSNDILVGGVVDNDHTRFDFTWSRGNAATVVSGPIQNNDLLSIIDLPTIGADAYFVKVKKRVGLNPGSGCESAPFKVEIADKSQDPDVSFTLIIPNSSCTPSSPNGFLEATASERVGPAGSYTFIWSLNGGALPAITTPGGVSPVSQLTNAGPGTYLVEVTNTTTGCKFNQARLLETNQTLSLPNIIDIDQVNPTNCLPQGSVQVVSVTIGGTNVFTNPPDDLDTDWDYEWYKDSFPAGLIAGQQNSLLSNQLPGKYFVRVKNLITDCVSSNVETVIDSADIVYPVVSIQQITPQVICTVNVGSGALNALADGQSDINPNYEFNWFTNLNSNGASFASTSSINSLVAGDYSLEVHNLTTNCRTSAIFILPENKLEFTPVLALSSNPLTECDTNDGSVFARGVRFPVDNTDPAKNYPFAYDYRADLYVGNPPADLNNPEFPDLPQDPNNPLLTENHVQQNLPDGIYTVRLTDNNTGCFTIDTILVDDLREFPQPVITSIAPVTNCDPANPNGVARVLVDGNFIGFDFNWYEGGAASGTPVYTGVEFGELKVAPQIYTVEAINLGTGCTGSAQTSITNGTLPIPAPQIEILSHVTSCIFNNGALSASVGGVTRDFIFDWYDGSTETPPSDFVGEVYDSLAIGTYSVTATSRITGCKSPLVSEAITDKREFPEFNFQLKNASCDLPNGFATISFISTVGISTIEWISANQVIAVGPNLTNVGFGMYSVNITSELGCETSKDLEILADIRPRNGISRNGDSQNDYFHIDCIENFISNNVKIFNRAGTLVYEADSYDNANIYFSGGSNRGVSLIGTDVPDGTYFYIVDKRDGSKPLAGYLEIVK